jgi:type VI protein secretion system component VasF
MMKRLIVFLWTIALRVPLFAMQPPAGQSEFRPMSEVPASEQLPAGPLLVGAYVFFLVVMLFYVWTIWRRLNKVESDIHALARKP